nr:diguanylate cyclase [Psychromonas hadalis]
MRLKHCIRHSDTVARIGGDEFIILLENINNKSNTAKMINTISNQLKHPFVINNEILQVIPFRLI